MRLILASTSPRRRDLLALLGVPFEVIPPDFDETAAPGRAAAAEAVEFAAGKAAAVAKDRPRSIVIGSDTLILVEGEKIGKPDGLAGAKRMLRLLAGKTHRIFTGIAILDGTGGPGLRTVEEVSVRMRGYTDAEIDAYLACGESLDKAGAYSIQGKGRALIESVDGDFPAAIGLALGPIAGYLRSRGISVPGDIESLSDEKTFLQRVSDGSGSNALAGPRS